MSTRTVWSGDEAICRRTFLQASITATLAASTRSSAAADLQSTTAKGDVQTPTFYRHDLGFSSGRLHEPSADTHGNLWFSPLDGRLFKYHTTTGQLDTLDLEQITGRSWNGLHLWPVAHRDEVFLCSPAIPHLLVYHPTTGKLSRHEFPHPKPQIYGGFAVPNWPHVYLYDTGKAGLLGWDPQAHRGKFIPCPYRLSGTLYMTFAEPRRNEIWGSTYTGNDLVRFDVAAGRWTGHWKSPLPGATPTPANAVLEGKLYVSDHLNGRLVPFSIESGTWGEPIPIPGFRDWFGYVSGGTAFGRHLYFCHSTWTGGNNSIDGKPHRFLGTWTVFDPHRRAFSRLHIPANPGESFISAYALATRGTLFITAVNINHPRNALVLRSTDPAPIDSVPADAGSRGAAQRRFTASRPAAGSD